jgi:hypothetical protein
VCILAPYKSVLPSTQPSTYRDATPKSRILWRPLLRNDLPKCAVHQMWTLLLNGRARISALPTQRFFEYTGQININPLLRDIYKQNAYFRGNECC